MRSDNVGCLALPDDSKLLEGAPRLFAIVADSERRTQPNVVAWGHELPGQAVLTWQDAGGTGSAVVVFRSAQAALAAARLVSPARLLWATPATEGV